jgi:hypothetical protein
MKSALIRTAGWFIVNAGNLGLMAMSIMLGLLMRKIILKLLQNNKVGEFLSFKE